jgi:hypothetical protein
MSRSKEAHEKLKMIKNKIKRIRKIERTIKRML